MTLWWNKCKKYIETEKNLKFVWKNILKRLTFGRGGEEGGFQKVNCWVTFYTFVLLIPSFSLRVTLLSPWWPIIHARLTSKHHLRKQFILCIFLFLLGPCKCKKVLLKLKYIEKNIFFYFS